MSSKIKSLSKKKDHKKDHDEDDESILNNRSDSEILSSHSWVRGQKTYDGLYKIYEYKCKKCKTAAYGSTKKPTVWASFMASRNTIYSCDEYIIKKIIQ